MRSRRPSPARREHTERLLAFVATERISGGAVYDAVVGATAHEAEATLLTLDRRAVATYQRLGLDYSLLR